MSNFVPVDAGGMQLITSVLLSREEDFDHILAKELPLVVRHMAERQVRHELPIDLPTSTLLMAVAFVRDDHSKADVLIVDLLEKYGAGKVTAAMLSDTYPNGWYDEESYKTRLAEIRLGPWAAIVESSK